MLSSIFSEFRKWKFLWRKKKEKYSPSSVQHKMCFTRFGLNMWMWPNRSPPQISQDILDKQIRSNIVELSSPFRTISVVIFGPQARIHIFSPSRLTSTFVLRSAFLICLLGLFLEERAFTIKNECVPMVGIKEAFIHQFVLTLFKGGRGV